MKYKEIISPIIVIVSIAIIATIGYLILINKSVNKSTESIYSTTEPSNEQLSELENGRYFYQVEEGSRPIGAIQLVNGVMEIPGDEVYLNEVYSFDKYFLFDINQDGIHEVATLLYHGYGANRIDPVLFVFVNHDGLLKQLAYIILPDRAEVGSISVKDGDLVLNLSVYLNGKWEPPTRITKTYRFSGSEFKEFYSAVENKGQEAGN